MIPLEHHMYTCCHVMHTWLLPLQNDLWKTLWIYMLNYILHSMMSFIIYIFDIVHNIKLGYTTTKCVLVLSRFH
jgi:hypothetical protein